MQESNSLRWRIVVGGIICQFCAGMFYSWSMYVGSLMNKYNLPKPDITLAFSIATLLIPIVMIFASKVLGKRGPKVTALIGAAFIALGLVISNFASSIYLLYLGYGVFCGVGVGFIYGVPIATCTKWFPDKKGLISGMVIAGFGLGSIVFSPIAKTLIETFGSGTTFLIQGGITIVGTLIGASMMKAAPDGFRPAGWQPAATSNSGVAIHQYSSPEMLRTSQYWFLLVMYLFANVTGLFAIGNASPIFTELAGMNAGQAGIAVSILGIANTLGRFAGGAASDKLGAKRVVTIIYALDAVLLLTLPLMGGYAIVFGIAGLGVCFGGMMGAYPSLVMDNFGAKHAASNYALVFLAYGIGGMLANMVLGFAGEYNTAFLIIGASCVVGVVMSLLAKRPTRIPAKV